MPLAEPRVAVIEGRRALVVERRPPLPPTLDALRRAMTIAWETRVTRQGARSVCLSDQDHRLIRFIEGRHIGLDGLVRDLRLFICADCEAVCVRDVTRDRLQDPRDGSWLPTGSQALRRRDHVLGWYSGARPGQREYR